VFAALPLPASMRAALQLAKQHGSADIVILSDANTIAIQECLAAHGLDTVVSAIITNVASWTPEGRLQIQRFVPADAPHGCVRMVQYLGRTMPACSLNICKGQVIRRLRVGYDRVIYLGDGKNDFCPGCELTSNDVYMPRRDRALHKILNGPDAASIRANIIYWSHADEVLQEFKALFQVVLTSQVQQ
jgi:pyridoxal phosphate phosphatase PHOSPHO2